MLTARDIMTENMVAIHPDATIKEAIELLLTQGISGFPVCDDEDRLVGVITEYALLAIVYDDKIQSERVAQHMTSDVLSIDIDDPISRAADLCIAHRVHRVPVLHNGHLAGLISRRDVLKSLYEAETPVCTA